MQADELRVQRLFQENMREESTKKIVEIIRESIAEA